jgi:hypothetical protein
MNKDTLDNILKKNPTIELGSLKSYTNLSGYEEALDSGSSLYHTRSNLLHLKGWELLEKLERNSVVYSALNNFKLSVIEPEMIVKHTDKSDKGLYLKSFLEDNVFTLCGNLNQICYSILDGVLCGHSISEKIFKYQVWDNKVYLFLKNIKTKKAGMYSFKLDDFDNTLSVIRLVDYKELPKEKFIIFQFLPNKGNPYGFALFDVLYPLYFALNELQKLMLLGASKFSNPSVVLYIPDGVNETASEQIKTFARNIAQSNIGVLPDRIKAEMLDITNKSRNPYIDLLNFFSREIEKVLLLNDLTVSQGDRYGTRAEASVKVEQGKMPLVRYTRRILEEVLFEQVIVPLLRYNFDEREFPVHLYPKIVFKESNTLEKVNLLNTVSELTKLGYLSPENDKEWVLENILSQSPRERG